MQAKVLPIADRHNEYARSVVERLRARGLRAEVDLRSEKIGAKIRDAQLQKIPFMLVVGDREAQEDAVAVRDRKAGDIGTMAVESFASQAAGLAHARSRDGLARVEAAEDGAEDGGQS